jgi:hypothetical protein
MASLLALTVERGLSMKGCLISSSLLVVAAALPGFAEPPREVKPTLDQKQFVKLRELIKPTADESHWAQVPWMPSTNLWAARQKAAKEGKPLLIWYMAGEPLGSC